MVPYLDNVTDNNIVNITDNNNCVIDNITGNIVAQI